MMMDVEVFVDVWDRLCRRFGRDMDREEAMAYMDYLEAMGMGTEDFVAAARVVWARREFFPRPVDFIMASHSGLLMRLQTAALEYRQHDDARWLQTVGGRPSLGLDVVRALGGMEHVAKLLDRGTDVLRREVEDRLGRVLDGRTMEGAPPLSPGEADRAQLTSPGSEVAR